MDSARWARPAVADTAKIVKPLHGTIGEFGVAGEVLRKSRMVPWEVIKNPMDKCRTAAVLVVIDQSKGGWIRGSVAPSHGWGDVLAFAAVFGRDRLALFKGGAGKTETHI